MAEELSDADRRALELLRDQDERFAQTEPSVRAALVTRWLASVAVGRVGSGVSLNYTITDRGRTVLEAQRPG